MEPVIRKRPVKLGEYLETMSKAVFQAGISRRMVEYKWPEIKHAFYGFHPTVVAHMTSADAERLTHDWRVIRNRRKIEAVIGNARRLIELDKKHAGFPNYLSCHNCFTDLVEDLGKQFPFLGEKGANHFLSNVGEDVPPYEQ